MAAQISRPPSSPVPPPAPLAEVSPSERVELYCTCRQPEHGAMIACDNEECPSPDEWYHVGCVGLNEVIDKWYCTSCETHGKKKTKKSRKGVGGRPSGSAAVELSREQTINMHSMIEALGGHVGVQDWFYILPNSYTGYRVTQKVVSTAEKAGKCSPPMVAAVAYWTKYGSSAVVGTELVMGWLMIWRTAARRQHRHPLRAAVMMMMMTAILMTLTMMLGAVAKVMGKRGRCLNCNNINLFPPSSENIGLCRLSLLLLLASEREARAAERGARSGTGRRALGGPKISDLRSHGCELGAPSRPPHAPVAPQILILG